jgi:adenosine 3'-phospho 5'-phosphosulfate transporter B2
MTIPYGQERFSLSMFLVFINRAMSCVFALSMICVKRENFKSAAPLWKYLVVSMSNVAASTCQYEALKYVSFPVQMLGKSFKMMPVMVWGMYISHKRYTFTDWLVAAAVTGGVTAFLMTGSIVAPTGTDDSPYGLLLLVSFLVCDGLTSTMQEKLFREHATSKFNQMFYVNLCSGIISVFALSASRSFHEGVAFCFNHHLFFKDAVALSATAVASQWFILSQVKEFGALVFAATMNVRQVVSILVSYLTYHHYISWWQCAGLSAVFLALFYKSYVGFSAQSTKDERKNLLDEKPQP